VCLLVEVVKLGTAIPADDRPVFHLLRGELKPTRRGATALGGHPPTAALLGRLPLLLLVLVVAVTAGPGAGAGAEPDVGQVGQPGYVDRLDDSGIVGSGLIGKRPVRLLTCMQRIKR
jgi:hypothetical protein